MRTRVFGTMVDGLSSCCGYIGSSHAPPRPTWRSPKATVLPSGEAKRRSLDDGDANCMEVEGGRTFEVSFIPKHSFHVTEIPCSSGTALSIFRA